MSKRQAEDITAEPSSVEQKKGSDNKRSKKAHGGKKRKEKKANNNLDENGWDLRKTGWKNLVMDSERFTAYYKAQGVIPEEEWDAFMTCLRTPLPTSFRITQVRLMADEVKKKISAFQDMKLTTDDGSSIDPPKPIPWYPNDMGWRYNPNRNQLRKYPQFEEFHKFLNFQGESGNITRQEEVSMIPPFLLKVEPHHKVLDMCAAPGSKTTQLIEFLHANNLTNNNSNSANADEPPSGLVIANDADETRCYTLTHQIKRLCSSNVIITNHFAQTWPFIKVPPSVVDPSVSPNISQAELAQRFEGLNREGKVLYQFDRILCDVPCSGDGTLRKNQNLWTKWHISMGNGLHKLQYQIASRGVHLLKVGGRLVYSTCSLNPVENEAVVAELLRTFKGCIELEDVSTELPKLKRRPGMNKWKVSDRAGKMFESFEDLNSNPNQTEESQRKKLFKSMFPPSQDEVSSFNLNRCMRIFPHDSDTGGFFIAVFRKLAATDTRDESNDNNEKSQSAEKKDENKKEDSKDKEEEEPMMVPEEVDAMDATSDMPSLADEKSRNALKRKSGEAPFLAFPKDLMPQFEEVRKFYGISESFPMSRLMIRSEKSLKIYYVSPSVRDLLHHDVRGVLRILNTGIKSFERGDKKDNSPCRYRLAQEGIDLIFPFIGKRKVVMTEADLLVSLREKDPFFHLYSDRAKKDLELMEIGSFTLVIDPESDSKWAGLRLACWRGKTSCRLLVSKLEVIALVQLAGTAEDVEKQFKNHQKPKGKDQKKSAKNDVAPETTTAQSTEQGEPTTQQSS